MLPPLGGSFDVFPLGDLDVVGALDNEHAEPERIVARISCVRRASAFRIRHPNV